MRAWLIVFVVFLCIESAKAGGGGADSGQAANGGTPKVTTVSPNGTVTVRDQTQADRDKYQLNGTTTTTKPTTTSSDDDDDSSPITTSSTTSGPAGMPVAVSTCSYCSLSSFEQNNTINKVISASATLTGHARTAYESALSMVTGTIVRDQNRDRQASPEQTAEIRRAISHHSQVAYEAAKAVQNASGMYATVNGKTYPLTSNMQRAFYETTRQIYERAEIPAEKQLSPRGPMDYATRFSQSYMTVPEKDAVQYIDDQVSRGNLIVRPPVGISGRAQSVTGETTEEFASWENYSPVEKLGRATSLTVLGDKESLMKAYQIMSGYKDDPQGFLASGAVTNWDGLALWGNYTSLPGVSGGMVLVDKSSSVAEVQEHEYNHAGHMSAIQYLGQKTHLESSQQEMYNALHSVVNDDLKTIALDPANEKLHQHLADEKYFTQATEFLAFTESGGENNWAEMVHGYNPGISLEEAQKIQEIVKNDPAISTMTKLVNAAAATVLDEMGIDK